MEPTGLSLIVLAAVCLIAAIVGGNVSLPGGAKFPALQSRSVRLTLAMTACFLGVVGLVLVVLPRLIRVDDAPSNADYVAQANTTCDQAARESDRLGLARPSQPDYIDRLERYLKIQDNAQTKLRALPLPAKAPDLENVWAARAEYLQSYQGLISALRHQDPTAEATADRDITTRRDTFNQQARQLGLAGCLIR